MSLTFANAGAITEIELMQDSIERLENLAYQAERVFWDLAQGDWEAQGVVDHAARIYADGLCAAAQSLTEDFLLRLARLCSETYSLLTLSSDLSLYAGGKYLEQQLEEQKHLTEAGGVQIITLEQQPEKKEEYVRIPTAIAVTETLHKKMEWLKHFIWNCHKSDVWDGYSTVLATTYAWCRDFVDDNIGTNFPTPLTSYYSHATVVTYALPKIRADASEAGLLSLHNISDYSMPTGYTALQGNSTGFHLLATGDTVHIAKLDVPGYEDYVDRIYTVNSATSASALVLDAPAEVLLPPCESESSHKFGDIFVIRKLRSA